MAHALRYYKELTQPDGTVIRLEIHKKKLGDAIAVASEIGRVVQALHLDIQGGADTIDAPVVKTSLTMTFVDAPDLEEGKKCGNWEEFYTPDSTMWMVVLKADGKTIWGGYVTPDSYQEDLRYRGSVTIIARDNIGHMQDFPFDMEGNADGMVTLQELVNEAWAKIESPMRLDWWHEEQEAMYLMCEGNDAPSTYMNVSAFEDMNYFDAVEKALYSYGLVMRYTGSNRVTIMSLRDLPYQGKSGAPRAIEPTFIAHAQRELAPAVRRIEESVKYEDIEAVQPQVKPSDFSGVSDHYAYEFGHPSGATLETAPVHNIINTDERNGWANMPGKTLFFNAGLYELSNFDKIQPYADIMHRYMYIAVNNVQNISLDNVERFVSYGRNMLYQDFGFSLNLGILIEWSGALVLSKVTGYTLSGITYAVGCEYEGDIIYYAGDGKWQDSVCEITQEISGNEENNTIDIPVLVDRTKSYKTATFILYIRRISYTRQGDLASGRGLYAAVQSLSITHNNALLSDNTVNTVYNNDNNVIISREPEIAPALNSVILPSVIKNGIFVKSGNVYLPAKGWAWSGGTPQQMAVYNHLQLLCYHSKPNNIISGDIVNADFVDMEAIYEWGGANHLLVSGSYNFLNGRIESAVLREFKFYAEMWSDVAGAEVPETEQNNRTTAESGSGASKAATYSNVTTVNIGGTGGGGTGGSSTLAGLLDVQVSSPSNGQALVYDSASGMWMNKTIETDNDITSQSIISALGYTPFDSDAFTKANIKNALGIKDWALASSKPSYTWTEIGSRPTALSEFTNDLGLGSLAYKGSLVASDIPSLPWSKITSGKPTTLSGYGITDAVIYQSGIDTSSAYKNIGYGHATTGWKTSGPAMIFGTSSYSLAMQCAIADADYVSLYLRMKYNGVDKGWDRVVTEGLLSRGAIAFDAPAYKSQGETVLNRNTARGDTYLNFGAANADSASLGIFGKNINFYAGVASSYTTYLQLYNDGSATFFVPLTLNNGVKIPQGQSLQSGDGAMAYDGVSFNFTKETNSLNFPIGGALSADPSSSFRQTCFGRVTGHYALRVMRPGGTDIDGVATRWGAFLAISPGDTHGFVHFPAYATLKDKCYIGGGISDALTWKATLFHNDMNLAPKTDNAYSLGDSSHRWKEVHATSIKIGDATLTWDATAGMLKIDKGIYSTGSITAKKQA
jgi:hypothetical protein